jgi:rhomboid protease GluP
VTDPFEEQPENRPAPASGPLGAPGPQSAPAARGPGQLRPVYTPPAHRFLPPGWLKGAPVTVGLIGLNVCAYLVEIALSSWSLTPSLEASLLLGASYPLATAHDGRVETLVTACFLHGSLVHLLFNMIALIQAGPIVERTVGSARTAPMYIVAGICGYALSVAYGLALHTQMPSLGASGAIAGLVGAAGVVFWRIQGWKAQGTQAMVRWLGLIIGFGVAMDIVGGVAVDNAAHVGGALSGAAIAMLWKRGAVYSKATTRGIVASCAGVVVLCFVLVGVRDRRDPFAAMLLPDRILFTKDALDEARCDEAKAGLAAIERLKQPVAGYSRLEDQIEARCGAGPGPEGTPARGAPIEPLYAPK